MSGTDVDRILNKLDDLAEAVAGLSQWKTDTTKQCDTRANEMGELRDKIEQERLDRTRAVGKLWTAIGRKLTAQATVAAFLGALGPSLVLAIKVLPALSKAQAAAHAAGV